MALALDFQSSLVGDTASPASAVSGVVQSFPPWKGLPYRSDVDFPSGLGAFLGYAEQASYVAGTRTFVNQGVAGASWMRLRLEDDLSRQWVVYVDPSATAVALPRPPTGLADRTVNHDGSPASARVEAIAAWGGLTVDNLVDFGNPTGVVAADLLDWTAAWSSLAIPTCQTASDGGC